MNAIADVQSSPDQRNMPINQVGIKDLHFPLQIQSAEGVQHTIARIGMTVALPASQKGTHMSRFVALMEERQHLVLDFTSLHQLTLDMLERLDAQAGRIHISFPYYSKKAAPVSGITSFLDYAVTWQGEVPASGEYSHQIKVLAPVTSLCPCSKEISQYGAHNQRSHVTVTLTCHKQEVSIEEIIDLVENKASCQLYGLLKRPDEKYVTEHAYENPKFVEDMVRDIAVALKNDPRIDRFSVESENFESIHNHSAYALIEYP